MSQKEWRQANRDKMKEYNRKSRLRRQEREKNMCKMDCFNCQLPDCTNSRAPTKEEQQMLRDALGFDNPAVKMRKELEEKEYHRMYSHYYYLKKKGMRQ